MKDAQIGGLPAVVGMIVLAAIYGGVVLAIYPGWDSIWLFLNTNLLLTKEAPAWVQAIGSIGALLIAVYVPTNIFRATERTQRENDFVLGAIEFHVVKPKLKEIEDSLNDMRDRFIALKMYRRDFRVPQEPLWEVQNAAFLQLVKFTTQTFLAADEIRNLRFVNSRHSLRLCLIFQDILELQKHMDENYYKTPDVYSACVNSKFERKVDIALEELSCVIEDLERDTRKFSKAKDCE